MSWVLARCMPEAMAARAERRASSRRGRRVWGRLAELVSVLGFDHPLVFSIPARRRVRQALDMVYGNCLWLCRLGDTGYT